MAEIRPFKGTLYNPELIKDLSKVIAPPYDVISQEEQGAFYNQDPHNIIRILLGKEFPRDNDRDNKYLRARKFLKEWQEKGILKRDSENAIYMYLQEFKLDGDLKKRLGFIALLKLEEFGENASVYPHENIMTLPKEDRLKLLTTIEANLGPIFSVFSDEDRSINKILEEETSASPLIDIKDFWGIRNRLWRITDTEVLKGIVRLMKNQKIFIADGHHRYEAGLLFSKTKNDPKFGYTLTYFTDLYDEGIVILPVHRLVGGIKEDMLERIEEDLAKDFSIKALSSKLEAKEFLSKARGREKRFLIYRRGGFIGLSIDGEDALDVGILHERILEPLKRKVSSGGGKISVDFTKDMDYAINKVDQGSFSLVVLLNPTRLNQVRDMAFLGKRMPQKSTYFYPKVLTGLVMNVF